MKSARLYIRTILLLASIGFLSVVFVASIALAGITGAYDNAGAGPSTYDASVGGGAGTNSSAGSAGTSAPSYSSSFDSGYTPSGDCNTCDSSSNASQSNGRRAGGGKSGGSSGGGGGTIPGFTPDFVTYNAGAPGELTIYSAGGPPVVINNFSVSSLPPPAGGGRVVTVNDGLYAGETALYSPTLSAQNGFDTYVVEITPPSSDSSSSSGGGGGGGCEGSDCTNDPPDGPTPSTGNNPWGGFWQEEETCTSSGKGGQSCTSTWVWVASPSSAEEGPCATADCTEESDSFSDDGNERGSDVEQLPIRIDAIPRLVRSGGSSTVEWESTDAESCTVKLAGNTIFTGTSGQEPIHAIIKQRTYVLQCEMLAGNILTSSVTISIIPIWREI